MTIAEIAALAEVSKTAVSRYLNNGYISQEKRERICKVIEETGYIPSRQAQNLRRGTTRTIGVILPRIDSETIGRIVQGISQELEEKGFQLLLANTQNNIERELSYLNYFNNDQVDGILFIATILTDRHRQIITNSTIPIVMIGQKAEYVSCIYHDDFECARELTRVLAKSGRRNIAMLSVSPKDLAAGTARTQGYVQGLRDCELCEDPSCIQQADFSIQAGYHACSCLMERMPQMDGILCATDSIAIGAVRYLKEQGRCIPRDIGLAGIGHSRLSQISTPTITTAHYYFRTSGKEAAKVLLDMLDSELDLRKQIRLGYHIVEQESTR